MKPKDDPAQGELALSSIRAHEIFPGRSTLYVCEIATVLRCTIQHVINLINEYEETGGTGGMKGFSIHSVKEGQKTPRSWWRVAVSDFDAFVQKRATSHQEAPAKA